MLRCTVPLVAGYLACLATRAAASQVDAALPLVDLAGQTHRQVIVDRVPGQYLGQPDTVLLADDTTVLVAYPLGHGGPNTVLKRSCDGGRTWSDRLPVPESFIGKHNSPTIHRVVDFKGTERLILFVSYPVMKQSVSEDEGRTWTPLVPVFSDDLEGSPGYKGHAPPKSVIPISDGRLLAMYHDHFRQGGRNLVEPMRIISEDGGLTWSNPRQVGSHSRYPNAHPCEPGLIRSPDRKRILCLLRENSRKYRSLWMTSDDEGETWSEMRPLPPGLTGDRHIARYTPDGRIVVTMRDMLKDSPTYGDFVMWVGVYDDIIRGRPGQCRVRLLDNQGRPGDTGYAGLELLPDGTFVSTTYCTLEKGEKPVVVSVRFKTDEIDKELTSQPAPGQPK